MGEIVNLRRTRKRAARDHEAAQAAAARLLHGRSRAERQEAGRERARTDAMLDGARLDEEGPATPGRRPGD